MDADELNRASTLTRSPIVTVVTGIPGRLWWTSDAGTVLADGMWANGWMRGLVVNLDGSIAPALTADRTRIVSIDDDSIEQLATSAAEQAVEHAWHIVGRPEWLSSTTETCHKMTDAIVDQGRRHSLSIDIRGTTYRLDDAGFMPGDEHAVSLTPSREFLAWRFSRLASAGYFRSLGIPRKLDSGVVAARPSDAILLGAMAFNSRHGTVLETNPWMARATSVYEAERHLEYPITDIVTRARQLALPLPSEADDLPDSTPIVRTALSFSKRQLADGTFRPLGVFDIVQTSWHHRVSVAEVCADLSRRFIEFDPRASSLAEPAIEPNVLIAASEHVDGIAPWLGLGNAVGLDHVVRVSRAVRQPASLVIEWLRGLGYCNLPTFSLEDIDLTDDDLRMLSCNLDGIPPFLTPGQTVTTRRLRKIAKRLGRTPSELEARLARFEVSVSESPTRSLARPLKKKEVYRILGLTAEQRAQLTRRHRQLMSRDGDGESPWFDPANAISAWTVATLAKEQKRTLDEVISDYKWLGYAVQDPRTTPLTRVPGLETVAG